MYLQQMLRLLKIIIFNFAINETIKCNNYLLSQTYVKDIPSYLIFLNSCVKDNIKMTLNVAIIHSAKLPANLYSYPKYLSVHHSIFLISPAKNTDEVFFLQLCVMPPLILSATSKEHTQRNMNNGIVVPLKNILKYIINLLEVVNGWLVSLNKYDILACKM